LTYRLGGRNSVLRPYVGARGQYNILSLEDEERSFARQLSAESLGFGAFGGLDLRFSRNAALQLGVTYSGAGRTDIERKADPGGDAERVGQIEDWDFLSGHLAVFIRLGS
jgi:opacity protein-like surface antigen